MEGAETDPTFNATAHFATGDSLSLRGFDPCPGDGWCITPSYGDDTFFYTYRAHANDIPSSVEFRLWSMATVNEPGSGKPRGKGKGAEENSGTYAPILNFVPFVSVYTIHLDGG